MVVGIIGIGQIGSHLSVALQQAGHSVEEIRTHCAKEAALQSQNASCDLLLLCVRDSNLFDLNALLCVNIPVAHVSGAVEMQAISNISPHYGVFYCLQTFSENDSLCFSQIPILIEASDASTLQLLDSLASSLSKDVRKTNSTQRKWLHLAAVFACNYTNLMYTVAADVLENTGFDFSILQPLIQHTAEKTTRRHPLQAQTGPALRGDKKTLESHQKLLQQMPLPFEYEKLYAFLANFLKNRHGKL